LLKPTFVLGCSSAHQARVHRYITWPGQATAYKVGERFLHKLRAKAEDALLDKFDPRDFYDVVLQCGAVPLDVLESLVDEYIANASNVAAVRPVLMSDNAILETMTFTWCKCCVVPGSCNAAT
jgi:Bacterial protein of unknown function (DUF885)